MSGSRKCRNSAEKRFGRDAGTRVAEAKRRVREGGAAVAAAVANAVVAGAEGATGAAGTASVGCPGSHAVRFESSLAASARTSRTRQRPERERSSEANSTMRCCAAARRPRSATRRLTRAALRCFPRFSRPGWLPSRRSRAQSGPASCASSGGSARTKAGSDASAVLILACAVAGGSEDVPEELEPLASLCTSSEPLAGPRSIS
mmetsp:Transcript_81634/g.264475  ORF Transcript_81634/g.264475 Transcript_81634/m.264475 type:complete len:204 (+) Transcript_81634:418-1029(+)